jgi:5-methylcytosine-specific restriction enzyme subunit McrC
MIRRTILEWGTIGHGDLAHEIPMAAADRIAEVAAASSLSGQDGSGVLENGRRGLRAKGIVGVIAAQGCAIEILPKIDFSTENSSDINGCARRRLIQMLAVALDLKIDTGQLTALDWQHENLLEILIRVFSEKLLEAARRGMPRRYVEHFDDLPVLRGRLDVMRQFGALAADPSRLACRFDALTADVAINQIMKATIAKLRRIARSIENERRLQELAFVYADIASIPISMLRWNQVILDRTNSRWHELINLARLLLGGRFQTTSVGGSNGFSLLFEMNTLFEEYITRMLKRALVGTDLSVISQGGRIYCLETDGHRGLFQTRPDILVKRGDEIVQIIDTKWKRIATRIDDPKQGVSQADVYQMMAYGQLYKCGRLTLLYPHHSAVGFSEGIQAVHKVNGTSNSLETATIDIAKGDMITERLKVLCVLQDAASVPSSSS